MNDYISLRVNAEPCSEIITDLVADALCGIGFESFEPDEKGVTAYIPASDYSLEKSIEALADFPIDTDFSFAETFVKGENWNEEWEKHYFQPIVIGDRCVVHSSFHKDYPKGEYDIVIDPKMAFGTGHHSTTTLMINYILSTDMKGRSVIDMGTGTGILSILCKMRGAVKVTGIEIDEPAFENAIENASLNNTNIGFIHGDASALINVDQADYFFANINRNVITSDFKEYIKKINPGGALFLSGFYKEDIPVIKCCAETNGYKIVEIHDDNNWCALKLKRSE